MNFVNALLQSIHKDTKSEQQLTKIQFTDNTPTNCLTKVHQNW